MSTAAILDKPIAPGRSLVAWLPIIVLPLLAGVLSSGAPAWILMWCLAVATFASFKWLTLVDYAARSPVTFSRAAAYLLLWPGTDAPAFFASAPISRPRWRELVAGLINITAGLALLATGVQIVGMQPFVAGWLGMIGVVFVLHFGVARVQSYALRRYGIDAPPIMQAPLGAKSLAEFWGRRWNLAFRDVMHAFVFRPLVPRLGACGAMAVVFLISGVLHDLIISIPARAGYGLPTLYFLIHFAALLFERSRIGRRWGLGRGGIGRVYGAVVVLAPVGLLFHPAFVERVAVPMIAALAKGW